MAVLPKEALSVSIHENEGGGGGGISKSDE